MKKQLITDLVLVLLIVLFSDHIIGYLAIVCLICTGGATLMKLFSSELRPSVDFREDMRIPWKKIGNIAMAAVYVALIVVMIRFWGSVGSMMIFAYLVIRLVCVVAVALSMPGHSPLHVDYDARKDGGSWFLLTRSFKGTMAWLLLRSANQHSEEAHGALPLDEE